MTIQEAIELFKRRIRVLKQTKKPSKRSAIYAMEMAIKELEKQMPRADAEELDCKNCIWNDYPVYFKNKCVPCELLKCDCFSKVMYEEWSDMNE